MRVLAVDGSKIMLPGTPDITEKFGQIPYVINQSGTTGSHNYGLASVLYDVLNKIAIDSTLSPMNSSEIDLAIGHQVKSQEGDLHIYDRNYPSYVLAAVHVIQNKKFVMRCSRSSFRQAREMLSGKGEDSQIVQLTPHHSNRKEVREKGLPESIQVRFVRVILVTGEYEVLMTNLCDEVQFPHEEFLHIYQMRWGIESFYGIPKFRK